MFQRDCLAASKEKREKGAAKTALKKSKRLLIKAESKHRALVERKYCWVAWGLVTQQKWSSFCKQAVVSALSFMQLFNSEFGQCLVSVSVLGSILSFAPQNYSMSPAFMLLISHIYAETCN